MRRFLSLAGFVLTLAIWSWVKNRPLDQLSWVIVIVAPLGVLPLAYVGRAILNARPAIDRGEWVTSLVHFLAMALLGTPIIEAIKLAYAAPGWRIPIPTEVGLALMAITGVVTMLTVLNLAVRGLGAPFAIALSRRLATDWMYAWTRNPMVLSTLALLLSVGLWLQSVLFVIWVVCIVSPVWLVLVKVYEERELEIRFGAPYLAYRAKTPMLWPRRPKA